MVVTRLAAKNRVLSTETGLGGQSINSSSTTIGAQHSSLGVGTTANSKASFSVWFKPNVLPNPGNPSFPIDRFADTEGLDLALSFDDTGSVGFYAALDDATEIFNSSAFFTVAAGVWYHAVITFDDQNSIAKVYMNGIERFSIAQSAPLLVDSGNSYSLLLPAEMTNGLIDDLRVYNTALSASEVSNLYAGKHVTTGLVNYWKFDGTLIATTGSVNMAGASPTYDNSIPSAMSNGVVIHDELLPRVKGKVKALATETITVTGGTLAILRNKIRTRSETTVIAEQTPARLSTKLRPLTLQSTAISESLVRIKGKIKALPAETITIGGGTLARLAAKTRTRSETVVISENLLRLCSKMRALAAQTVTIGAGTIAPLQKGKVRPISPQTVVISETPARLATKARALALQTVTVGGGTLARLSAKIRALALQTVALTESVTGVKTTGQKNIQKTIDETIIIAEASLARLAAKSRALSVQSTAISENLARLSTKIRALATQTTAVSESLARIKGKIKAVPAQTVTITGGTLARLAAKSRTRTETIIISENLLRLSTKIRNLATQIVAFSDVATAQKTTGAQNIVRALTTETVAISESLARLSTKIRALTTQIVTISEAPNRSIGKFRLLTVEFATISDALNRTVETTSAIVRSLSQSVAISESLNRLSTKTRALSTQITAISENLARIKGKIRVVPAQTVTISGGSLARQTQKIRAFIETITTLYDALEAYKNGVLLTPPVPTDKGGSGDSRIFPRGPRLKQIKYPVYHVTERLRIERRRKLRQLEEPVIIPAFKQNIHKVVAPFVIVSPNKNSVKVRFAVRKQGENGVISFSGAAIPVKIAPKLRKYEANKAFCASFVMNQRTIERYGKKLNKIQKLMTLLHIMQQMPSSD